MGRSFVTATATGPVMPSSLPLAPRRAARRQTRIAARRHRECCTGGFRPARNAQQFLDVCCPAVRTGDVIAIKDELFKSVVTLPASEFVKGHIHSSQQSVVSSQ